MDDKLSQLSTADAHDVSQLAKLPPLPRRGYRFVPSNYTAFMQRDKPHPIRAVMIHGLQGQLLRSVQDYSVYEGHHHSRTAPLAYRVSLQGSPNSFNEARLRAYNRNLAGRHLTQRANLVLSAREFVPNFDESWLHDTINGQILSDILNFTAQLLPDNADTQSQSSAQVNGHDRSVPSTSAEDAEREHQKRLATMYSDKSGRLVPPASKATSRPITRSSGISTLNAWKEGLSLDLINDERQRLAIQLLCQFLQTEDLAVVSAWIGTATESEKNILKQLLNVALNAHFKEQQTSTQFSRAGLPPHSSPAQVNPLRPFERLDKTPKPLTSDSKSYLLLRPNRPEYDYQKDKYA